MLGLKASLYKKTKSWTDLQSQRALFQKPKLYFSIKLILFLGIFLQRILILTDDNLEDKSPFNIAQLIGLPLLFLFEVGLFYSVQKSKRLKKIADLLFGGFQIIISEFLIALSIPICDNLEDELIYMLQQEILFICFHLIMFINSFPIKTGLLSYICLTFIFRLSPILDSRYYAGWSIMALSIIASFFIILFSKDQDVLSSQAKPSEDFSKLENIPHGLAILTRDKQVIFMNGVFKGILSLTDERDALQKILKMKRFEAYSEETQQLLLKEIKVRMNSDLKSKTPESADKAIDLQNFSSAHAIASKRRKTLETPAIYIKRPPQGQNSPFRNSYRNPTETSASPSPQGVSGNFNFFINRNKNNQTETNDQSRVPLSTRQLSHLTSLQVQIESDKDEINTVEFSINSLFSSLLDESPDRVRRKISLARVAKNVVNGLFIRRASQKYKKNNNVDDIFDLADTKTQKVRAINRDAKGDLRILEITLTPMWSGDREALFIYLNDVTSEIKARELHESSLHKDRLLKFVSHEFRTPLNVLMLSLNTIKPHITKDLYDDYLAPALNSTFMLLNLVNDILDYSQMQAKRLKIAIAPCNLKGILEEVVAMMEMQASAKNLDLILDWDPKIPRTYFTDSNRLKQILVNLISNALKFTTEGSITIKGTYLTSKVCKLEVIDTGVGISQENLNSLFKEFGKIQDNAHLNPQGVGLGLVISKLLSQELGSDQVGLQVKSTLGIGTSFYFFLASKRHEEAGFENTDLNSSGEDQEPSVWKPKSSEPHSRRQVLQKKTSGGKTKYAKAQTASEAKRAGRNEDTQQPFTLNFKHVYSKSSFTHMTSLVSTLPKFQGDYVFKSRRMEQKRKQRCLSTGIMGNVQIVENNFSEQVKSIVNRLNKSCKCPKVLLVDDNAFNLTALKMLLKSFQIEAVGVIDGQAAIQEVLDNEGHSQSCKNFAIIFMDIEMPHLNGFETATELRRLMINKEISYMPIVGITGHNPIEKRVECLLSGMNDMVCKPVNPEMMQELICKWVIPEC